MQRKWTIEIKVAFADEGKLPVFTKTVLLHARRLVSTARMLADIPKNVKVIVHGDDFLVGEQEINLMQDLLDDVEITEEGIDNAEDKISPELLALHK